MSSPFGRIRNRRSYASSPIGGLPLASSASPSTAFPASVPVAGSSSAPFVFSLPFFAFSFFVPAWALFMAFAFGLPGIACAQTGAPSPPDPAASVGERSDYEAPAPSSRTAAAANASTAPAPLDLFGDGKKRLLLRADDLGMNHATNQAFKRIAEEGLMTAASVMVITPWLDEAVEILKQHPEISVGVHTCINSEWVPYRWGPVLPARDVPSLVDEWGKFFGTRAQLVANNPNPDEVEKEVRAQIDLALAKGLNVSYIDHHMSGAVTTPELKERFVRIAKDYNLPISRWCGEVQGPIVYSVAPDEKLTTLIEGLKAIDQPGTYLVVLHPSLDHPEMRVLRDLNVTGLPNMPAHRQAETDMLCAPELKRAVEELGFEIVGYDTYKERFPGLWIDPASR